MLSRSGGVRADGGATEATGPDGVVGAVPVGAVGVVGVDGVEGVDGEPSGLAVLGEPVGFVEPVVFVETGALGLSARP